MIIDLQTCAWRLILEIYGVTCLQMVDCCFINDERKVWKQKIRLPEFKNLSLWCVYPQFQNVHGHCKLEFFKKNQMKNLARQHEIEKAKMVYKSFTGWLQNVYV